MKRLLTMLLMMFFMATGFAQNINKAEYFFDHDPGQGNGTLIPINSPADIVHFTTSIPLTGLGNGFHTLAIRVRDTEGTWSSFDYRTIYILSAVTTNTSNSTSAEYFFDSDPGAGKGTSTSVGTAGPVVNFTATIPTNISPGFHWLGIRVKDADGKWGLYERRNFYLTAAPVDMTAITAAEYFFDHDPGPGNGSILTINSPGYTIAQLFSIPVPGSTSGGTHLLTIRVKDQAGNWSLFAKDSITVSNTSTISCPENTTVTAAAGQCSAVVNGIDPTVSPQGSSYTYTLTGATTGSGTGTASGHSFNAGSTTVTYALTSLPTTTCSFTVTVNTNVVPSVSIDASATTVCSNTQVTFTATPTNGGAPTYQWRLNGVVVGNSSNVYQHSSWSNGDAVSVAMISSLPCANPSTVLSNTINMTVSLVTPSVSITTPQTTICSGTQATFTSTSINGGTPAYQWKLNGNNVGDGSNMYENSNLVTGDEVKVVMTSSLGCANPQSVTSNGIMMTVLQSSPAFVSISTPATTICSGTTVTFTASPGGGGTPTYQWKLNGNNVGNGGSSYQNSSLQNGDKVKVVMTPSSPCAFPSPVVSNEITMTVNSSGPASVSISASQTSICTGQPVTFTATIINGGTDPAYEWTLNNNAVGNDTNVYQSSSLQNGDVVRVAMQPYGSCSGNAAVYSNTIAMTVGSGVAPSVSITASAIDVCAGTPVMFTATPTNGGSNPHYQWKLNGNNVGGDSAVYHNSTLANADTVKVVMTSSLSCATSPTATSNYIAMDVSPSVTPSVSIVATATTICMWTTTSFTATPTNGGPNPTYQWKLNGNNTGINNAVYENSDLVNGDVVSVVMTSSLPCANPGTGTSNTINMTVLQPITYYGDADGDGYGSATSESGTVQACGPVAGFVTNNSDCDDGNGAIHPGATEICGNGTDDNCNGIVDENCSDVTLPVMTLRTYPVKEGDVGETTLNVTVTLDVPAPMPVSVHYATTNGDAVAGSDYLATSGSLFIPAGSSSGTIPLKIIGDVLKESNERFSVNFSDPINVTLGADPRIQMMIIDDDKGRPNNTITHIDKTGIEEQFLKIPSVARRNQVWMIPQIGMYENEVLIMNAQGQLINRFINYRNHTALSNIASGLYFYRIRILDGKGQVKYYAGSLLVTE